MTSTDPAVNYERYFVPAIGAPLAQDLVDHAALRSGERVLDLACGTGIVARLASQKIGSDGTVVGLDVNPAMLAVAQSTVPSGMSAKWHQASAEEMPLPDASFDVVLCQMGLQFMPDKQAALRESRRVLVPGGRLILNVPGPTPPVMAAMENAIARHIGNEAAGFVGLVFSLHDTEEIQKLLDSSGFQNVSVREEMKSLRLPAPKEFLWQYVHSTPLAGVIAQADDARHASLEDEFVHNSQKFVTDRDLMVDLRMVVATAHK